MFVNWRDGVAIALLRRFVQKETTMNRIVYAFVTLLFSLIGCRSPLGGDDPSGMIASASRECRTTYPGCEGASFAPGCYMDCADDAGCDADYRCTTVSSHPCWGLDCEACAADARICLPVEPRCEMLTPGCGPDALPVAACYVRCSRDADCGIGESCHQRSFDPCAGKNCDACGAQVGVCLPVDYREYR